MANHLDCDCYLCQTQTTWDELYPSLPEDDRVPPRDLNRIRKYLLPKSQGQEPKWNVVHNVSFQQQNPEILYNNLARQWDNELYLFTRNVKKYGSGNRFDRQTEGGTWKPSGGEVPIILRSGEVIGYRKSFQFVDTRKTNWGMRKYQKTNWRMREYRLPDLNKQYGGDVNRLGDLVLRVIELKDEKQRKEEEVERKDEKLQHKGQEEEGNNSMCVMVVILLMTVLILWWLI